jgi:hypothetical protein
MTKSHDGTPDLDFERDLPTTPEDIEALRSRRPQARLGELKNLNQLFPPEWMRERQGLRRPFGDWPPFEL